MPTDQLRIRFGIKWREAMVEPAIPPEMRALLAQIDSSEQSARDKPPDDNREES